jgi:hypothetical protein
VVNIFVQWWTYQFLHLVNFGWPQHDDFDRWIFLRRLIEWRRLVDTYWP